MGRKGCADSVGSGTMMRQTRLASLFEAIVNVGIGFVVSVGITAVVLPAYGHPVGLGDNLQITGIFTVSSILRSYVVRRWFNARIHAAVWACAKLKGDKT